MSIIITNITTDGQADGPDRYMLRVNQRVICEFDHERKMNGLAQCLRDAADAAEIARRKEADDLMLKFVTRICQDNLTHK